MNSLHFRYCTAKTAAALMRDEIEGLTKNGVAYFVWIFQGKTKGADIILLLVVQMMKLPCRFCNVNGDISGLKWTHWGCKLVRRPIEKNKTNIRLQAWHGTVMKAASLMRDAVECILKESRCLLHRYFCGNTLECRRSRKMFGDWRMKVLEIRALALA